MLVSHNNIERKAAFQVTNAQHGFMDLIYAILPGYVIEKKIIGDYHQYR